MSKRIRRRIGLRRACEIVGAAIAEARALRRDVRFCHRCQHPTVRHDEDDVCEVEDCHCGVNPRIGVDCCVDCSHALSFHGEGETGCRANACSCPGLRCAATLDWIDDSLFNLLPRLAKRRVPSEPSGLIALLDEVVKSRRSLR